MKTLNIAFAAITVLLSACTTGMKAITTPDGKRGFMIQCDDSADGWSKCTTAASSVCQGKYRVLDKLESTTSSIYGPIVSRHLIAECKL